MKNIKLSENFGGYTQTEENFNKVYDEYLEDAPAASETVRNAYKELGEWFEKYVCAIEEEAFRHGYERGYKTGQKGGVTV